MIVREEYPADAAAIRRVNELAFGQRLEADLVDVLRREGAAFLSLVAEVEGEVAGHILFSPITFPDAAFTGVAMGLGPMAVLPHRQNRGLGTALVRVGLRSCRERGVGAVVVLGHPDYYPRFGFAPAEHFGLRCAYPVPPGVFMVQELQPGALAAVHGLARYQRAFDDATAEEVGRTIIALERAALERWGRGDPSGFLEICAPDVVYFDPYQERRLDGLEALTSYYESLRGKVRVEHIELLGPRVQATNDVAVLTYNYVSRGGNDTTSRWNCTEVYRRAGDEWQIIQTHWSFTQPRLSL